MRRTNMPSNHNFVPRRRRLWAAAAMLLFASGLSNAKAQDYPSRTVTVIVPFAAGGPADITGRITRLAASFEGEAS